LDSLDDRKRALRARMKERSQLPAEVQAASAALQQRLLASGLFAGARTVALFRSLPSEVQTAGLAEALSQAGVRVVYPVVPVRPAHSAAKGLGPTEPRIAERGGGAGEAHGQPAPLGRERVLAFHTLTGATRRGPLGVEEPAADGPPATLSEVDLFILPGLAADPDGHRLGRGRGYYDATLAAAPHALGVMVLFDSGLVPEVPVGDHDVQVDAVCTDSRLLLCSARARERAARGDRKP
jgi:5-formyltetrahydrofolate cyclo-ligase